MMKQFCAAMLLLQASLGASTISFAYKGQRYFPNHAGEPVKFDVIVRTNDPDGKSCAGMLTLEVNGEQAGRYPARSNEYFPITYTPRSSGWQELRLTYFDSAGICLPTRTHDLAYIGRLGPPYFKVWPVTGKLALGDVGMVAGVLPPNAPAMVPGPYPQYMVGIGGLRFGSGFEEMVDPPFYRLWIQHDAVADRTSKGYLQLVYGSVLAPLFPLGEFELEFQRDGRFWLTTWTGATRMPRTDGTNVHVLWPEVLSEQQVGGAVLTLYDGTTVLATRPAPQVELSIPLPALAPGRHLLRAEIRNPRTGMRAESNVFTLDVTPEATVSLNVSGAPALTAFTETDRVRLEARVSVNGTPATSGEVEFVVRGGNGVVLFSGKRSVAAGGATIEAGNFSAGQYRVTAQYLPSGVATGAQAEATFRIEPGLTVRNAASGGVTLAPNGIASLYGRGLSGSVISASGQTTSLGGVGIEIEDANRRRVRAPLFFASPTQVNFLVPDGVATGAARVEVMLEGRTPIAVGTTIARSAPGIFTVDGGRVPSGLVTLVDAENRVTNQFTFRCPLGESCQAEPVVMRENTREAVLTLYGTGFRGDAASTIALAQGQYVEVLFAGAQPEFPGLDQINLRLPVSLRGRGKVTLELRTREGAAQAIELEFR